MLSPKTGIGRQVQLMSGPEPSRSWDTSEPKLKIRNPKQIGMTQIQMTKTETTVAV